MGRSLYAEPVAAQTLKKPRATRTTVSPTPCAAARLSLAAWARRALGLLRRVGFDYARYYVYSLALDAPVKVDRLPAGLRIAELTIDEIRSSSVDILRDCHAYTGRDARLFGVFDDDGALACVQCIWYGERFASQSYWTIERDAAMSMHLVTAPEKRNKGFATWVKQFSAGRLRDAGFSRVYSRIWWTNTPSLRVSEKVGWSRVGTLVELTLPGRKQPVRLAFRQGRR